MAALTPSGISRRCRRRNLIAPRMRRRIPANLARRAATMVELLDAEHEVLAHAERHLLDEPRDQRRAVAVQEPDEADFALLRVPEGEA